LREEKEMGNLAKLYLTDVIRHECWDDMLVKGRGIVVSLLHSCVFSHRASASTTIDVDACDGCNVQVVQVQKGAISGC